MTETKTIDGLTFTRRTVSDSNSVFWTAEPVPQTLADWLKLPPAIQQATVAYALQLPYRDTPKGGEWAKVQP